MNIKLPSKTNMSRQKVISSVWSLKPLYFLVITATFVRCNFTKELQTSEDIKEIHLAMPNVSVPEDDLYFCHSLPIPAEEELYVVGVRLAASLQHVHHLAVGVCEDTYAEEAVWECLPGTNQNACKTGARNLWGWNDRKADDTNWEFPADTGIFLGKGSKYKHFVVQIHYAHAMSGEETDNSGAIITLSTSRKRYTTATLMTASTGFIPPHQPDFESETGCEWSGPEAELIGFKVHTHDAGRMVEAYLIRHNVTTFIGKADPHVSQAYQKPGVELKLRHGDFLAARCHFENKKSEAIKFGSRHTDEMCNLYILARAPHSPLKPLPEVQVCTKDAQTFHWSK